MWERFAEDDDAEEHITASASLAYFLSSRGLTVDDLTANPVVIAAFQPALHRSLVRLTNATPARYWTEPQRAPLAHGTVHGRPVSVILLPVGAPWAVFLCELLIAVGARAIIAAGAAGSLSAAAPIGTLVIPDAAIREEVRRSVDDEPVELLQAAILRRLHAIPQRNLAAQNAARIAER